MKTRITINGRRYHLVGYEYNKRLAENWAKKKREQGYRARVVKTNIGGSTVYLRYLGGKRK
jgi:hypothetical protein